jgi:hypothetical protein
MNIEAKSESVQPAYVEMAGIRFFGEQSDPVKPEEVDNLKITDGNRLHISRHLNSLSPEARTTLLTLKTRQGGIEKAVDDDFLNAQLKTKGSKFNEKITNPEIVMEVCREIIKKQISQGSEIVWIKYPNNDAYFTDIEVIVDEEIKRKLGLNKDDSLGTAPVVEITPEIAGLVKKELRGQGEQKDQIEVNVIEGMAQPETDKLIIEIKKNGQTGQTFFGTAYPGIIAPGFSNPEKQSPDEAEYKREWWGKHAFIK